MAIDRARQKYVEGNKIIVWFDGLSVDSRCEPNLPFKLLIHPERFEQAHCGQERDREENETGYQRRCYSPEIVQVRRVGRALLRHVRNRPDPMPRVTFNIHEPAAERMLARKWDDRSRE